MGFRAWEGQRQGLEVLCEIYLFLGFQGFLEGLDAGFVISIILPLTMYVMPYDLTISTLSCHMPGRGTVPLLQRHFMMASKLKARKERSVFIRSLR